MQDETEAAGSVLWMAPEVLLKENIDSKLDVYSFSLVLWEILSRADLFSEFEDKETFTEAVAVNSVRPPLVGIHPALQSIISSAWDRDSNKRPTFEELLILLQKALIEIYLPENLCPTASAFWEKYFRGKSKAPWDQFMKRFAVQLGKRHQKILPELACLEKLLAEEEGGEKFISIERFSALLKWFGQMKQGQQDVLLRIQAVMAQPWFFGVLSASDSEEQLKLYKDRPGTFMVRLNMGGSNPIEKAPFTISRIDTRGKSVHTRIQVAKHGGGFRIKVGTGTSKLKLTQTSPVIEEFIKRLREEQPHLFGVPCPGWPFKVLFSAPPEKSVYEEEETDSDGVKDD